MADFVGSTYTINEMPKGIAPADVLAISAQAMDGGVKIRVTPPQDTSLEMMLL